jgi:hypothetical protein
MDSSEQHRHRCETRQLLAWRAQRGKEWLREFLSGIERKRGPAAADRLRYDIAEQWKLGSRGERGDWRQAEDADAIADRVDIVARGAVLLEA